MLPITVLRRFDCVLAPTKQKVLAEYQRRRGGKLEDEALDQFLNEAAGERFHNHSALDFEKLRGVHGGKVQEDAGIEATEADEAAPGRNPAFRRLVLEVYDYQCAACGLRIKLPDADLTFVDGAHIIPFNESRNDHPTNGLALCKNHHWAMDRFLIVPTPKGIWKASPRLNSRRSQGEADLIRLDNEPLLPPHDEAFNPDPASLAWRSERLFA